MIKTRALNLRGFIPFLLFISALGCSLKNPSLNSFQAAFIPSEWVVNGDGIGEFKEIKDKCKPKSSSDEQTFVFIHGIYGDKDTFDKLPKFLYEDLKRSSIFMMEYWSDRLFPNLQSLSELGRAFKEGLEEIVHCRKPKELIIIAHSQGGLIAKESVLGWIEQSDPRKILDRTKLILIGTPNYFSTYAALNNLFVNSVYAPVTYAIGMVSVPFFDKAFVYNRQAYDMAEDLSDLMGGRKLFRSRFMTNHITKWGEKFPSGVMEKPNTYAIVGIKDLLNDFALSDGIVHSDTLLYAGIPSERVYYVPYRHFDAIAAVHDKSHLTFKAIEAIIKPKEDCDRVNQTTQRLSPFQGFPYSWVTFVTEKENASLFSYKVEEIELNGEESPFQNLTTRVYRSPDWFGGIFKLVGHAVLWPFNFLQTLVHPVVNRAQYKSDLAAGVHDAKWEILRWPTVVFTGHHAGHIKVSREIKDTGIFPWSNSKQYGMVNFLITDENQGTDMVCEASYVIPWDSSNEGNTSSRKKIQLQANSVNYIKIEFHQNKIKLIRAGCEGA